MLWTQKLIAARRVSVPLVAITTSDPAATIQSVAKLFAEDPIICWDIVRGEVPVNEAGRSQMKSVEESDTTGQPAMFLSKCQQYEAGTIICVCGVPSFINASPLVPQGIWNLRDSFKGNRRMLILLGDEISLPGSLVNDVVVIDESLPDDQQLNQLVRDCDQSRIENDLRPLTDPMVIKSIEAIRGLSAFAAEQAVSMALTKSGINLDHLWELKAKQVEQTKGLSVWRGQDSFEDIAGLDFIKGFFGRIIGGKNPPNAIVWIDEIEKMVAGSSGASSDSSGVSQGILGAMLTAMQDQNARGVILLGPPGAGKSLIAKAVGKEAGCPTISWDSNAMKQSLVGSSEAAVRNALKVISAVSSNNALWIATCNSIAGIPTALRRRFNFGTYYFDLPTAEERRAIWKYYIKKYGLKSGKDLPDDSKWTGAEIRTCCDLAWNLSCDLVEASRYFVPVAVAAPGELENLRVEADGRYLSASSGDIYSRKAVTTKRRIQL